MAVRELNLDEVKDILTKTRSRGSYDEGLDEFLTSESAGVEIDLEGGPFSGKKSSSIMTGFKSAKERALKHDENSNAQHVKSVCRQTRRSILFGRTLLK